MVSLSILFLVAAAFGVSSSPRVQGHGVASLHRHHATTPVTVAE